MTPAIRVAEAAKVAFQIHRYKHDPAADSFGLEAAEKLALSPERVFKTLVAQVDGKSLVVPIIPVAARLDLKRLASVMAGKKADMADPAAAERATGYVLGGISPLGGRKRLPTLLHESTLAFATIFVSAGQRGLEIELSPQDLARLTHATIADIIVAR
ncbi:MAG: Cys-tRNA(Pro) deacylase [Gemmataceae bacterium]|nr:Cys-tRNA(Pro) deacylase [Gemmataceae bacterium]